MPSGECPSPGPWRRQKARNTSFCGGSKLAVPRRADGERNGFGSQLLSRQVQHEWGGTMDTDYAPEGIVVTFRLPENGQLYVGPGQAAT